MAPIASAGGKVGLQDLVNGALLQCVEAATLGMPFEVWKTHMGRFRNESTIQAFGNVYKRGGIGAFWAGLGPKLVESASKGGILLWSKEAIARAMDTAGVNKTLTGFVAGGGGGVCQVAVMGPCTFLVTGAVTGDKSISQSQRIRQTWAKSGIKGFYPGGVPLAFRQMTNWASRQGFTEAIRGQMAVRIHGNAKAKLTVAQEAGAGLLGGALSCWNHPFEVARIQMQSAAGDASASNAVKQNMMQVFSTVYKESGVSGLFKGVIPRVCLGMWQTLFMVSGAKLITRQFEKPTAPAAAAAAAAPKPAAPAVVAAAPAPAKPAAAAKSS